MTRDVDFEIGADVSPLKQKLREARDAVKSFADEGGSSIGGMVGPLGALQEKFVAVGAILAGGAVFAEAVNQAKEWTEQSVDMAAALGITATEAGNLKAALAEEGVEMGTFMGAAQKLSANLKENEGDLNAMGIATRDAAGNIRPLVEMTVDAIEVVNGYKAGADRAMAANVAFGKGFEIAGDLAKVNSGLIAENTERQQALAAVVTNESIAAFEEYDVAGKGVSATLRAIQQTIGTVLMPVLATLANWFIAIGPAAVTVIRGAFGGLASTFHLVTTGVTVLWETINAMVVSVAEPVRGIVSGLGKALQGDFDGAKQEISGIAGNIKGAWVNAFDTMAAKAQSTRDRISNIFSSGTAVTEVETGGKSGAGLVKGGGGKKEKKAAGPKAEADLSYMQYYDAALAERKRLVSEEDALREYTKAEELAYWQLLLGSAQVTAKDRLAIEKKVADLTVQVRRDAAREALALDAEAARSRDALAVGRVDAERAAAQVALDLEQITKVQMAELELKFEQDRLAIQRAALQERLALAEADPNLSPAELARVKNELLELEQRHQLNVITLQGQLRLAQKQAAQESLQIWSSLGDRMSGLWDKGIQAMMNGTLTWRNGVKAVGAEMVAWFAKDVVGKQVMLWLAGEAKKLAIKIGFLSQETAAQVAGSTAVVGIKGTETAAVAGGNAVQAGSGAAAAMSSIPYIGPILALAAMATVFAAVSSLGGGRKSAAKGYDIPKGINPLVQTHEEEMILPAKYANAIRSMTNGEGPGGGGGGTFAPSINVQALDSRDVVRTLRKGGALHSAIRGLHRDFERI